VIAVPGGYDAQRHNYWPAVAGVMPKPWPREASCMDLLWWVAEARVFGRAFPSRSQLADRWGWTEKRVRVLLADPESWQDQERPAAVEELRPKRKGQARARQGPDKGQDGANTERFAADDSQERASEGPGKGRTRASEGPQARVSPTPTPTPTPAETSPPVRGSVSAAPPVPEQAPIPDQPPIEPPATPPRKPRPSRAEAPGYREAIASFHDAHLDQLGTPYPWQFGGRDSDGARVKTWLQVARVDPEDPDPGLDRIRRAVRVYFAAEKAGEVFPFGVLPTPARFSRQIAEWLRRDPDAQPDLRTADRRGPLRRETLSESLADWADLANDPNPTPPGAP